MPLPEMLGKALMQAKPILPRSVSTSQKLSLFGPNPKMLLSSRHHQMKVPNVKCAKLCNRRNVVNVFLLVLKNMSIRIALILNKDRSHRSRKEKKKEIQLQYHYLLQSPRNKRRAVMPKSRSIDQLVSIQMKAHQKQPKDLLVAIF